MPRRNGDLIKVVAGNKNLNKFIKWRPKFNNLSIMVKSSLLWEKNFQLTLFFETQSFFLGCLIMHILPKKGFFLYIVQLNHIDQLVPLIHNEFNLKLSFQKYC